MFAFYFYFTFSVKYLQPSLIIRELIKHENKFNRKVFHDKDYQKNKINNFLSVNTIFFIDEGHTQGNLDTK